MRLTEQSQQFHAFDIYTDGVHMVGVSVSNVCEC